MSTTLREIARLLVETRRPGRTDGAHRSADRGGRSPRLGAHPRLPRAAGTGKKVLLITGGVKSWSVVSALQEAGLEVVGTSTKKSTKEDKEKIKEIMGDDAHMIDDMTPREMYAMLRDAKADIMLSGGRSQFVALKARMPWMDINQERHHAFAGYEGMVTMMAEIDKALFNPVWAQVRTPAPWEVVAAAGRGCLTWPTSPKARRPARSTR
jgi:nitrogenase molybdenum-cofactor synthesis protein NifE